MTMPIKDCMSDSPYCPANQSSEFAIPDFKSKGCDACVDESLKNNEVPKCFFNKIEGKRPLDLIDYSVEAFAKKVMDLKKKAHR